MSDVLNRLRKKRGYPCQINGDEYFVRTLTLGELRRMGELEPGQSSAFTIACALCEDAMGAPAIPRIDGEDESTWIKRAWAEVSDIPTETLRKISQAVADISKIPDIQAVIKN